MKDDRIIWDFSLTNRILFSCYIMLYILMLKISQSYPFISHVNHWWHHDSTEIGPDRWEIPDFKPYIHRSHGNRALRMENQRGKWGYLYIYIHGIK